MQKCITGKRRYPSEQIAEDALIEAQTNFNYASDNGPVAVYQCEDCGDYHLTSRRPMNDRLARLLAEGKIQRQKEANFWQNKFRNK
jgi:ABC-type ATPase with predicted acetyltransferase domain